MIAQIVERQAKIWKSEVQTPVQVRIFLLKFEIVIPQIINYKFVSSYQFY